MFCQNARFFFKKSSSKYTAVRFCKLSCMSVEKRTIQTASWGERSPTNSSNYRVTPTIWLLAGSVGVVYTGFHEQYSQHSEAGNPQREEKGIVGRRPLPGGLIYRFLTCGGSLDNMVMPTHNYQTGSMQIKPPLDVSLFRTDFDSNSPNRFKSRHNESSFAPRLRRLFVFVYLKVTIIGGY